MVPNWLLDQDIARMAPNVIPKLEMVSSRLLSERPELAVPFQKKRSCVQGTLSFFRVPEKISDRCLHLSVPVCEMEILVQGMSILVKEEPTFVHLSKGGKDDEKRNLQIAAQSVLLGFDVLPCFSGKE